MDTPALREPPPNDTLAAAWLRWIADAACHRGLDLAGVHAAPVGGWEPCPVASLLLELDPTATLQIHQRPGCRGLRTRVVVRERGRVTGALLCRCPAGQGEPPAWRALLLEAMVLADRHVAQKEEALAAK